jgi:anoctamin-10
MASTNLKADLVIQFTASPTSGSKSDARAKALAALNEYTELLSTLQVAGLLAAGKQGNTPEEILVIISCPWDKLKELVEHERYVCSTAEHNGHYI